MTKVITPLSIDKDVKKKIKELNLNMSEIAENAFKERLGKIEVLVDTQIDKCEFCGKEEEKATAENKIGLTWLYPDEQWICNLCLRNKIRKIPAGMT